MSTENKVISIAVGDKIKIEGVGTVQLVVVAPEQTEQPKQHPLVGKWVRYWLWNWKHAPFYNKWFQIESVEIRDVQKGKEWWITVTDKDTFKEPTINEIWNGINHQTCCFDLSNPCDFDCNMPEAVNPKYKVGDEVVVVDEGLTFSTYKEAFWFFGFNNRNKNQEFSNNTKAKVFGICKHRGRSNLYALRDSEGNECVIGEEGIKLVETIDKQEWFDAASRLFDSWMKISGGYVPRASVESHTITYDFEKFSHITWVNIQTFPFNFETLEQKDQFLSENEKDLKTFFHQV